VKRWCSLLLALAACAEPGAGSSAWNTAPTPDTHLFFPIASGPHAVSCETCHGTFDSFKQFTCFGCHTHDQGVTDQLHASLPGAGGSFPDGGMGYAYDSVSCLRCHASGSRVPFDHAGITATCASCHDTGAPFVALPVAGVGLDGGTFFHPDKGGNDCKACHVTTTWSGAGGAPDGVSDPAMNVTVDAGVPTWSGTSIAGLSPEVESLPMPMNHKSAALPAGATSSCSNCHASGGNFFPGRLHSSLAALLLPQPSRCLDCHQGSAPTGFVGPVAAGRAPPSGEMRHDAMVWNASGRTKTAAIAPDCEQCHTAATPLSWTTNLKLHVSVAAQPSSCLDCHANSRPGLLTSAPGLPAGVQFDHRGALGDCFRCHASTSSWAGGVFHAPGGSPTSCLPCHEGERPTSTSGWSAGYQAAPFDYTGNTGASHGAGLDCVACHGGPGTGTWGGTPRQNWRSGHFTHGPGTASASSCIACHMSQRPDLTLGAAPASALLGFDHALNGKGDCFGCHQATVAAGSYVSYLDTAAPVAGSSDWKGGVLYPGSTLISSSKSILVTELILARAGGLVTGASAVSATLYDAMLHTSSEVPPSMAPATSTDWPRCAKCHAVSPTDGSGTLADGKYHASLTALGLAQPATCNDCHAQMRPAGIVQQSASNLQPMDHAALFAGGGSAAQADCASCHTNPGVSWAGAAFHPNIGSATPQDCTVCHYPLMSDATTADVASAPGFAMRHGSAQLTFQNCAACHDGARAQTGTIAAASWHNGAFHASVAPQPGACVDCHLVSEPAAGASTQSSIGYALAAGGTSTNVGQWMNHGSSSVVGKDCALCHATDAQSAGSAWSKSVSFHATVASPPSCRECHGLTNGGGPTPGANNNLPAGLTSSSTVTTAAADATTGVPSGTLCQITHADVNVTGHDCNFCHTQAGVSGSGTEWAQAKFHVSFTAANPLVMNGGTGRCSNCHLNIKPTAGFPVYDHTALSATAGTQDCSACHVWPGTGTPSSANWLGASAAPALVTLTAWSSSASITSQTVTFAHPGPGTYTSCTQCHAGTDYTKIIDYNHDGLTSSVSINGTAIVPAPNLGTSQYDPAANPTFCVHCHQTGSPWINKAALSSSITADTVSGSTTVNTASTSALTAGMTIKGTGIPATTTRTRSFTGNITAGSTTVTTTSPQSLSAGTAISGTGIPANDTVATSVNNATSFTLTAAATATASGTTLTATNIVPLTVTIRSIASPTSFAISNAADTTLSATSLTVSHKSLSQATMGNHNGSTGTQDCTSCHYAGSNLAALTPPTPGVFGSGRITGN
jgi:hypothetical protein